MCFLKLHFSRSYTTITNLFFKMRASADYAINVTIHLTKTTAAQNEVELGYRSVRGLYFLAIVFVRSINDYS